jgi:hypothetical protein
MNPASQDRNADPNPSYRPGKAGGEWHSRVKINATTGAFDVSDAPFANTAWCVPFGGGGRMLAMQCPCWLLDAESILNSASMPQLAPPC